MKQFFDTYNFCKRDINKFILLLGKGVYPYEYMDHWKKFIEASMPEEENFCCSLNMEDITHASYRHAKKELEGDFEIKNLDKYYNLCIQSDRVLLVDAIEHFWNMCLEIYDLDSTRFFPAAELAWQSPLKRQMENKNYSLASICY